MYTGLKILHACDTQKIFLREMGKQFLEKIIQRMLNVSATEIFQKNEKEKYKNLLIFQRQQTDGGKNTRMRLKLEN